MNPLEFASAAFAVYALTGLLTVSHFFKPIRKVLRRTVWALLPRRLAKHCTKWEPAPTHRFPITEIPVTEDTEDLDLTTERDIQGYDAASCRQCMGVWVTLGLFAWNTPVQWLLGVYGAGYFLATQERE